MHEKCNLEQIYVKKHVNKIILYKNKEVQQPVFRWGNFKDINWVTWTTFHNEESKEAKFIEAIQDCYLYHQHNQQDSRRRR